MKDRITKPRAAAILGAVILLFGAFNLGLYRLFTVRLGTNYSDTSQVKMVDVKRYLPFESGSELVKADTTFRLTDELPVLDGAAALVPVYASVIHSVYPQGSVTYEGGAFSDDNYYGENFAPDSKMQYRNTLRGYKAIVDGDCDVFFAAAPSGEQRQYAEEKGVELVYKPIGREAFVFFVNSKNPVDDLTREQIRDIYGGKIKKWSEVGGANRFINPITRVEGSGSQTVMEAFMGDTPIAKKSPLSITGSSIGYSFRFYLNDMVGNDGVKMLSLDGAYPDKEHIQNGSYPLVYPFYAVYRADDPNPNVRKLVDWLLSAEGQSLIESCGYTSIK